MEESTQGIILKAIPFKENDRIITLFSSHCGMISLLAKKVRTPEKIALCSPFAQIEVCYTKSRSDLFLFKDGTLLSSHLFLREKWSYLESGAKMAHAIVHSQLPGKPAPLLYALLLACLKQLPSFEDPSPLLLLFHLKLLTHEGLLSWEHPSLFPFPVSQSEWEVLKSIASSRSFQVARETKETASLLKKSENYLKNSV